jgi:hypothetical protein
MCLLNVHNINLDNLEVKKETSLVLNQASSFRDVWGNGGIDPCIFNFGLFTTAKITRYSQEELENRFGNVTNSETLPCRKSKSGCTARNLLTISTELIRLKCKKIIAMDTTDAIQPCFMLLLCPVCVCVSATHTTTTNKVRRKHHRKPQHKTKKALKPM